MCDISSIRLLVLVLGYLKGCLAVYILITGFTVSGSNDILKGFGISFVEYGIGLVFLGLISGAAIIPMRFGVAKHNRFLMVLSFILDAICFASLLAVSSSMGQFLEPEFPKSLQLDCLRNIPLIHTPAECLPYIQSDRVAGMRLVWASYYTNKADKTQNQILSKLSLTCCGFFAPYNCIPDTNPFPPDRSTKDIAPIYLEQRVTCGEYSSFYPEQKDCTSYFDIATATIGGCFYDMGVDFCLLKDVEPDTFGCASEVEDYVTGQISGTVVLLIMCAIVNLLFMLFACCMWWKRKESDIFPEFVPEKTRSIDYNKVRFQFEVVPKENLLVKEGFIPNVEEGKDDGDAESGSVAIFESKP